MATVNNRNLILSIQVQILKRYLCDFNVYTGKTDNGIENNLGYIVVATLCEVILENGTICILEVFCHS